MSNEKQSQSGNTGVGLGGLLFLLFVALKLTGHIDWSWWWVTAPLWIRLVLVAAAFLLFILAALVERKAKTVRR